MADEQEKVSEETGRSNEDGAETQKDTAPPQEAVVQQMEANEDGEGDGLSQQRKRKASQEIVESDTNTEGTTTPVRDSPRPFYHFTIPYRPFFSAKISATISISEISGIWSLKGKFLQPQNLHFSSKSPP